MVDSIAVVLVGAGIVDTAGVVVHEVFGGAEVEAGGAEVEADGAEVEFGDGVAPTVVYLGSWTCHEVVSGSIAMV